MKDEGSRTKVDPEVLVRDLAAASDLPSAAAEFVDTVDRLQPDQLDDAVLGVLDDLAHDLAFFSPNYSWEDPSLMDETGTRARISEAQDQLRALLA